MSLAKRIICVCALAAVVVLCGCSVEETEGAAASEAPSAESAPVQTEAAEERGADVIINEYMTDNTFTVYDCEGDYGDWVELYNRGSEAADISGWGLTDGGKPLKWVFPEGTVIEPQGYLLVFCDGKEKTDAEGALHTSFSLSADDGAIGLYTPQEREVDSVEIADMPENISCGVAEGELRLFARPTPGRANDTPWTELGAEIAPDINDGVLISETLSASSSLTDYDTDYIEIFNSTSQEVNLGGYTLAQEPGEVFFTFPEMTLAAGGYVLVWCDGGESEEADGELYAPIKINTAGEDFYLAQADGRICDVYSSGKGRSGMSSGRVGSDTSRRVFFAQATPGGENSGEYFSAYAPVPEFDTDGGVVEAGSAVTLSAPQGFTIVYTLDGSEPTASSDVYEAPIAIDGATVIRAAALGEGYALSEVVTQTYFTENPHTIPIVSVSGSPAQLTGPSGLLTKRVGSTEYAAHFEYFDESGRKTVEFECGAEQFGQWSLDYNQKALKLSLREIYGQTEISYNFFDENDSAATTFTKLLLRPSGQDQNGAKLRDELIPAIVRGEMDIDYQEYRACALYVNGEYWGLYYIREHLGGDYLETYYDYAEGDYDLIKWQSYAQKGTMEEYQALERYCGSHDLTVQENYDYICSIVDTQSLMNFWITETYFGNPDTGNIRCYKTSEGKWRWMIFDFDWAMNSTSWKYNYINLHLLDPEGHGAADFSNVIIRKLLQNDDFRDEFITAYCYHIQNTFAAERVVPILEAMAEKIDGEIPLQQARWGYPVYDTWKNSTLPFLRGVLEAKPELAAQQLKSSFSLTDEQLAEYMAAAAKM
ncbi:MAG: CotH kinase family protein [Oscillospiraceae bacterium]|nr:CotH kinase family protein [Oscillospiraceae bacterium]